MNPLPSILLVEDDECDVMLLNRALNDAGIQNPVHVARDGQEAIEFMSQRRESEDDRLPALIILDLKMPRKTGLDVLAWKKEQSGICTIPTVVFSSSANRDDVESAYALGANAFVVKPPSLAARLEVARFIKQWLTLSQAPLISVEGLASMHTAYAKRNFSAPLSPP